MCGFNCSHRWSSTAGTKSKQNWGGASRGGGIADTRAHTTATEGLVLLFIPPLLTRPERIPFPLVHCVALGNVVELWQPPKLLPDRVVVEEGSHGIIHITNQALRKRKLLAKQHQGEEETAQQLMQEHCYSQSKRLGQKRVPQQLWMVSVMP